MALMKHVAVCSPDISKLIYQISCKLGAIGFSKMIEQKYGISPNCEDGEYTELKLYLEVFKKLQKVEVTDENIELSNIIKDLHIIKRKLPINSLRALPINGLTLQSICKYRLRLFL